jgi:hypothetical protein
MYNMVIICNTALCLSRNLSISSKLSNLLAKVIHNILLKVYMNVSSFILDTGNLYFFFFLAI